MAEFLAVHSLDPDEGRVEVNHYVHAHTDGTEHFCSLHAGIITCSKCKMTAPADSARKVCPAKMY